MRESSSGADETHSLHGAAESFYAIVIAVFTLAQSLLLALRALVRPGVKV